MRNCTSCKWKLCDKCSATVSLALKLLSVTEGPVVADIYGPSQVVWVCNVLPFWTAVKLVAASFCVFVLCGPLDVWSVSDCWRCFPLWHMDIHPYITFYSTITLSHSPSMVASAHLCILCICIKPCNRLNMLFKTSHYYVVSYEKSSWINLKSKESNVVWNDNK